MRYYIYKLSFRNGATYIGKHTEKKENDGYITSSSYYKKHKDLLERRDIILEVKDIETLDIMETICIMQDICANPLNVNYNYGAWLDKSHFDRGFVGVANGMYGRKHNIEAKNKMKAAWVRNREERCRKTKEALSKSVKFKEAMSKLNANPEHIKKCIETRRKNNIEHARYACIDNDLVVDFETYTYILKRDKRWYKTDDDKQINKNGFEEWLIKRKTGRGQASKGKHWYNNGIIEIYDFECPDSFVKGRLKFSKETISNMKSAQQKVHSRPDYHENHSKPAWNKGIPMSEEQKAKLRHRIKDLETGEIFSCISDLLEKRNISKTKYYKDKKNGKYTKC